MSANAEVMEHRWGTRVPLDLPAQLQAAGGALLHTWLGNASLSGAYVRSGAQLPLLSKVWVRPRGSNAWIEACVVRQDASGMGIEWLEPGTPAIAALLAPRARRADTDAALPLADRLPPVPVGRHLPDTGARL